MDYFHLLAVVNNAAYTYQLESLLSVLLGIYLEVELLDPMVILCLIFLRDCQMFPHCTFTSAMHRVPNCSHISANTCLLSKTSQWV